MAIFQTYVYRKRDQSLLYDTAIVLKFIVFLCSNVANALFIVAALLTMYLFIEFNHQKTLKVVAPFPEEHLIEFFFVAAFLLKVYKPQQSMLRWSVNDIVTFSTHTQVIKVTQHFWQQVHCDIFFIDWERPRVFEHQISLRTATAGTDTPSITSSVCIYLLLLHSHVH